MIGNSSSLPSFNDLRVLSTRDALPPSTSCVPENVYQITQGIVPSSLIYPRTLVRLDHLEESCFDQTALAFQSHFTERLDACSSQTLLGAWMPSSYPVQEGHSQVEHRGSSSVLLDILLGPISSVRSRLGCRNDEASTWDVARSGSLPNVPGLHALTWSKIGRDPGVIIRNAVSIIIVEPWILTQAVLHSMISKNGFFRGQPNKSKYFESARWEFPDTIWSIVYDHCVKVNSKWWVLSSYDQWVFGVFSAGWTSAFISPIKARDALKPTVTEALLWWLESAVHEGRPDYGYNPPEVSITTANNGAFAVSSQPFPVVDRVVARSSTTHKSGESTTAKPSIRYRTRSAKGFYGVARPRVHLSSSPSIVPTGLFTEREQNPDGPVPFTLHSWQAKMRSIGEWRAQATEAFGNSQIPDMTTSV